MDDPAVHLRALLRISTLLQSIREMYGSRGTPAGARFQDHLLSLIEDILPADASSIHLYEDGGARPETVDQVFADRAPIFEPHQIVVPLALQGDIGGAIRLERAEPFGEPEFQLVTAIAGIASLALESAFHLEWLRSEVKRLEEDLQIEHDLLGQSTAMSELRAQISRAAPSDATVLITGESGTGKELVARAIHRNSRRAAKPFVAINCAALAETLLESELFGHEKGAFTGAFTQKRGKLETASGGTVFLDEIGEMPVQLQAKLLRVLQERSVERVGGTKAVPLDFRLVAATNQQLEETVRKGCFRQDLYYRLSVINLRTPPLRSRPEDILPLAQHFLSRYGETSARKISGIAPAARSLMLGYDWPGNVRELENAMERATVLGSAPVIAVEDLPESLRETPLGASTNCGLLHDAVNAAKRSAVQRAFAQANDNHEEAARLLGVHPGYLYRLVKNLSQ